MVLAVLAAVLPAGGPVPGEDCNRNGIEDRVEIETPAIDFRLAGEVEIASVRPLAGLDFDGDGDEDLAAGSSREGGLVLLRNDGTGRLARAGSIALPLRGPFRSADLDRDSDLDLVLVFAFEVWILWNDSDGSFSRSTRLQVGSGPKDVRAADLDLDGDLDLITANFSGDGTVIENVSVLRNHGERSFGLPRNFASIDRQPVLCVADPDGDGDVDAVVGSLEGGDLRLLENDGDADFSTRPTQGTLRPSRKHRCQEHVQPLHARGLRRRCAR
jgi:hypothetical protein